MEVDISVTIPSLEVVGLPASEVKEARERVKTALRNSGFLWPNKKVLVNLAPSDVKKRGAGLDLPIALAILRAAGQIPHADFPVMALGELQLDGTVRPVRNALSAVICAVQGGVRHFVVARENAAEARSVRGCSLFAVGSLRDIRDMPSSAASKSWTCKDRAAESGRHTFCGGSRSLAELSYCDELKRAVQIAAAGRHASLLCGVPGTGKTAAAVRMPTFLPALSYEDSLAVSNIYASAGFLAAGENAGEYGGAGGGAYSGDDTEADGLMRRVPVRQPHHSASVEAMIGSGANGSAGEVSLAHRGVLILDEAPEFKTKVLQALREPLDTQRVHISSAERKILYPADCLFVLTCNLCPCGNRGRAEDAFAAATNSFDEALGDGVDGGRAATSRAAGQTNVPANVRESRASRAGTPWADGTVCMCSEQEVFRYWKRIGGALWDRIDIKYKTRRTNEDVARGEEPLIERLQHVERMQQEVASALRRQAERFSSSQHERGHGTHDGMKIDEGRAYNGRRGADDVMRFFDFSEGAHGELRRAVTAARFGMSDRARLALCRVSRTIADLCSEDAVNSAHVEEALRYTALSAH